MFLDVGNALWLVVPYGTAPVFQQARVVAATPPTSTLVVPHLGGGVETLGTLNYD